MNIETLARKITGSGRIGHVTFVSDCKRMRKRNNPLTGRVSSLQTVQLRMQDYASVKAKANGVSKDEVETSSISWAKHIAKFVIQHLKTGEKYLQIKPEKYLDKTYLVDGRKATKEEVEIIRSFMPKSQNEIKWFSVKLKNIKRLAVDGEVAKS